MYTNRRGEYHPHKFKRVLKGQFFLLRISRHYPWFSFESQLLTLLYHFGFFQLIICYPSPIWLIPDILECQLISNDKFKSAQHRVLAKTVGPRVSIACFFSPAFYPSSRTYAPIKELLSEDNPAKYREFSIPEFTAHYRTKCMKGTSPLLHFKIWQVQCCKSDYVLDPLLSFNGAECSKFWNFHCVNFLRRN